MIAHKRSSFGKQLFITTLRNGNSCLTVQRIYFPHQNYEFINISCDLYSGGAGFKAIRIHQAILRWLLFIFSTQVKTTSAILTDIFNFSKILFSANLQQIFLKLAEKNEFTPSNRSIIKNRVEKKKLEQILSRLKYSFLQY